MATPEALVAMAERVVAALPGDTMSWTMHASAHFHMESWSSASKSFAKVARLDGDEGNAAGRAAMLENAEKCRMKAEAEAKAVAKNAQAAHEHAEAEAKAAAEVEAARMAPIMAAREAAADAAMEALLAEEEHEKAAGAATAKPRKGRKGKK
jgi:colicin import membrane protein